MEYTFKFVNGNRLAAIGAPGVLFSFLFPVYLKVSFALVDAWMFGLMASLLVITCLIAYLTSKRNENFLITDDGLHTSKHGLVRWDEIQGLKVVDSVEHEVLTVRFQEKENISIPSQIMGNPNRQTFVAFREEMERRLSEARSPEDAPVQHAYAYSGKGYRAVGYVLLLALVLSIPYVLYSVAMGEMTVGKSVSAIVCIGGLLPLLGRIFRDKLFGKTR
jgi:hypothetical protein